MDTGPAGPPTIKAALLLGFGLTLSLWLWAGYDFVRSMSMVQTEAAAISLRYLEAQELLAEVRPQVLSMSINLRTALLAPTLERRAELRERIQGRVETVDHALDRYVPVLNSDVERERVARLRSEVEGYGEAIEEVLRGDLAITAAEGWELLNSVTPRRELVIGVTEEVQTLNRAAFVEQQTAIAEAYSQAQRRVWERLGVSLLASLAIAVLATIYSGRLESRLRRQHEKETQAARDLQQLSAKLVDAQEHERRVIARELHDELGQVLMSINVELGLVEKKLPRTPSGEPQRILRDAQAITQTALHTVRDLSHLLHPAVLDDLGLVAAVDEYLRTIGQRHALRTRLEQEGPSRRAAPDTELAAYRIVQEAVTNSIKHGRATACTVTIRHLTERLVVAVEDDGRGFDPADVDRAGAAAGLGLIGMRERVVQLHGALRVESGHGRGAIVTADFPASSRVPAAGPADPPLAAHLKHGTIGG